MNPDTKFVHFTTDWKIRWSEYDSIQSRPDGIRKDFITAYNNVPLQWCARIRQDEDDNSKLSFFIHYNDGPMEKINGVEFEVGVVKTGDVSIQMRMPGYEAKRGISRGWIGASSEDKDSAAVRTKYGLTDADRLVYQITVKIPIETFSYTMSMPTPKPSEPFLVSLFGTIDDPNSSKSSDVVKLISRDDIVYYCHKNVIAVQSELLATLFRDPSEGDQHPPMTNTNNESTPSVAENQPKNNGEYEFPTMTGAALKSMIEHLYTGKATMLVNLTATEVIEVVKEADKYALKPLMESCGAELWKRVVGEPFMAIEIARFADLHDMQYLKLRAFDVIVENSDDSPFDLAKRFDKWTIREEELRGKFTNYMVYRLTPYFKT